jgi:hypothetical protein
MSNNNENITYSIPDDQLQLAHKIAKTLVSEQKNIEPGREGISTELSKLITYLDSKIQQNRYLNKKQKKPSRFFTYIETLAEHGETIGHSKKTKTYYKVIHDVCNQYLSIYEKKPLIIIQILGWTQRLMRYYTKNPDAEIPTTQTESIAVTNPQVIKPIQTEKPQITSPNKPILPKVIKPQKSTVEPPKPWDRPRN